jgi:nucleoside-diphosphate-sugar epimerase
MRIFLAGAAGAIGRRLTPLLISAGHAVIGTTRSADKAAWLTAVGAEAVILDAKDTEALIRAVVEARPDVIMNQLTDLPPVYDAARWEEAARRNAGIRAVSAPALVEAAAQAGARRHILQSLAFVYAPGPTPHGEDDPLDIDATGVRRITVDGVVASEGPVLTAKEVEGIVLRYGYFYGPGTWSETPGNKPAVHVDAAAYAALLAVSRGERGIYNVAEDDGSVSIERARRLLGWDPSSRIPG